MRFVLVSVWCVSLALSITAAQDAAVTNASQIADKLGQPVEFQDEVKAVSYSRSTKGYYLSFGAPYPKQTLSVWIDGKIYDHLPMHHSMVGRTVHIAGQLENSPTGPLLKLASAEQFRVMPTDESILAREKLDGKQDRVQFKTAVWQIFEREDFNTLETLGEELRQSKERLYDGSWLSEAFLDAFRLAPSASSDRYAQVEQRLARWEQAKPSSIALPLIKAGFHLDLGWKWRGTGYANTVKSEGWSNFKIELATARRILESYRTSKSFPE